MNDQRKRRRSVDCISHLFLSCQDSHDDHATSPTISQSHEGELTSTEPGVVGSHSISRRPARSEGLEANGCIQLVIDPSAYPVAKLGWAKATSQDGEFEATIPLRREVWLDVAKYCKQRAERIDVSGPHELANTWNRAAELIMSEITADEKRQRNRDVYGSFADFVAAISAKSDIDKARRAQIIHEKACQLKLD